ncbi:hypothetical protein TNCV_3994411 [Trichonephila clavipes]|uniref:Uncharacterized protein n=1 Tax=Trichonephila clavipes TaxID=2585209 RepID=A0A8X6VJT6_TRICX|nr:hypothetical protein TNCV_3994411 [Trichonephila clavipes]
MGVRQGDSDPKCPSHCDPKCLPVPGADEAAGCALRCGGLPTMVRKDSLRVNDTSEIRDNQSGLIEELLAYLTTQLPSCR